MVHLALLALSSQVGQAAFDLNLMPEDGTDTSPSKKLVSDHKSANPKSAAIGNFRNSKRVSPALYAKILRLFDMLKVCEQENFDIDSISDSFLVESKALMVLNTVAKSNLIKKSDKPRFDRIMRNCAILSLAVQEKLESSTDLYSQMSGESYENRIQRLKGSPLEALKDRYVDKADHSANLQSTSEKTKLDLEQKIDIQQESNENLKISDKKPVRMYNFMF